MVVRASGEEKPLIRFRKSTVIHISQLDDRESFSCYARGVPTVCVTRAGAGGGTPSDWKNAEA